MLSINDPATVAAVTAAFEAYEAALVANDVPTLQAFFWNSPHAVRFGVNEQLYGFEDIAAFRRKRVINFSDRHGSKLSITTLGLDFASVSYEYVTKFSGVEREGRQTQVWARFDGCWKIVAAHVSLARRPPADGPDWAVYVDQASRAQRLTIAPECAAGVVRNIETMAVLAEPMLAFPLPVDAEPAPVFTP